MSFITKHDINRCIKIIDIADSFGIEVENISTGSFNYRVACPSKDHKSGGERTGSLYINGDENNYYCFGCQSSRSVIDFYMICAGIGFKEAFNTLKEFVDPSVGSGKILKTKVSENHLRGEISEMLRLSILNNIDRLDEIDSIMKNLDKNIWVANKKKDPYGSFLIIRNRLKQHLYKKGFK